MSLILLATITAAVAASAGYLAARRRPPEEAEGRESEAPEPEPAPDPFAALPFRLGDVVQAAREERWLAGAILAREPREPREPRDPRDPRDPRERDEVRVALFIAPEGAAQGVVAAFAPPRQDIYWMEPAAAESPAEPPATLEIGGAPMQRRGRVPVALERLGQGAPRVGAEGLLAMYEGGAGTVAILLSSEGQTYAWSGRRFEAGEYERLGSGGDEG